jgi:class 3 adenylate cyclase/tetratricopeptide (TPR) repeat protein
MPPRNAKRARNTDAGRFRLQELGTERKYVTVFRVDIVRSTDMVVMLELEAAVSRLEPALEAMRVAVRSHGGVVLKELGDGLSAVFGAPMADDRHATLACRAAIDLMGRIEALHDVKIRVGIHAGFVVASILQGDLSRAYNLDGPPLYLVERLQSAAEPGQILVSDEIRRLAETSIVFETAGRRMLKGFPDPVQVHKVIGVRGEPEPALRDRFGRTGFVGRATEYARLLGAAGLATRGTGECAIVAGEPGVGKSRLTQEAADALVAAGWTPITAECNTILGTAPFAVSRDLVAKMLLLPAVQAAGTHGELPPAQRVAIDVLLARPHDAAVWERLGRRARLKALIDAVETILDSATRDRPALILIEDLQWCDDASAPVIEALAEFARTRPVLMMVTARTGGLPDWVHRHTLEPIVLQPLDDKGARALIDGLLGPAPTLAALKQRVLDHTGRLPLFVIEVCRRLAELGGVAGEAGNFRLASLSAVLDVPPTVHGVIAARVDRLSPDNKRVLQTAAVIGRRVPISLLTTVSELPEQTLGERLRNLEAAALLLPADENGLRMFAFPHDLMRQVTYDALLTPEKVNLHALVLAALEAGAADGFAEQSEALVHHAEMARNWARAAEHAEHVARTLDVRGAQADASRYFERAIAAVELLEPSARREERAIDLRLAAVVSVAVSGLLPRWLQLAEEAEARASALGDRVRLTMAMINRAGALNLVGAAKEAVRVGQQALRQAEHLGEEGWLSYAEYVLGVGTSMAGDYREAARLLSSARRRVIHGGCQPPISSPSTHIPLMSTFVLVNCGFALGDAGAVEAHHRFITDIAERTRLPLAQFLTAFSRGILLLLRDEFRAAEWHLDLALRLLRQNDLMLFTPLASFCLGLALLRQARNTEAFTAFAEVKAETEALGMRSLNLRSRPYLELTSALMQSTLVSIQEFQAVYELAWRQGYKGIAAEALVVQGAAMLQSAQADADAASVCLRNGLRLASELGAVPLMNWASLLLRTKGPVLAEAGD